MFSFFYACNNNMPDTTVEPAADSKQQTETIEKTEKSSEKVNSVKPPEVISGAEYKLVDGGTFSFADSKDKVILVNLWATWCGPCRQEMPSLVELQDKYKDKGFEVIGLDVEPEEKEMIEKFAKDMKLNYKLGYIEREQLGEFFKIGQMTAIPQSFLFNRQGELIGIFQGGSHKVVEQMKENVEKAVNS